MLDRDGHQVSISLLSRSSPAIACDMRIMVARSRCSSEVSTVGKCAWETCGATSGWRRVELGDLGQRTPAAVIVPRLASVAPGYIPRCCQAPG